jgi:hypothetical protein
MLQIEKKTVPAINKYIDRPVIGQKKKPNQNA